MKFFNQPAIGLDLSPTAVRFVELRGGRKGIRMQRFGQIQLPHDRPGPSSPQELDAQLLQALHTLMKGQGRNPEVYVALPERESFIKTIIIHPNHHDLRDLVLKEIKNHVPQPIDDIAFDFQIMEKITQGLAYSYRVLFVGVPKKTTEHIEQLLQQANLTPLSLETESLALLRSLLPWDRPLPTTLIIDIGTSLTQFIIVDAHSLEFTTESSTFSSRVCAKAISTTLSMPLPQAQQEMLNKGFTHPAIQEACGKPLDLLLKEMQGMIEYYQHHVNTENLQQIILTGGGANLKGLKTFLSQRLNLSISRANPVRHLQDTPLLHAPTFQPHSFAVALGLALTPFQSTKQFASSELAAK